MALAVFAGIGLLLSLVFSTSAGGWLIGAGFCLFLGLAGIVSAASRSGSRVDVFERGLNVKRGGDTDAFSYDDVRNVWYRSRTSGGTATTALFNIELNSGRKVAIEATAYQDNKDLATSLFRKLTTSLTARAMLDLIAGKRLSFGTIQVDRAGVSNGHETIPWSEVSEVRVNAGTITINRQGKWLSWAQVSTERTPNVLVLLMIADAIKGVKIP